MNVDVLRIFGGDSDSSVFSAAVLGLQATATETFTCGPASIDIPGQLVAGVSVKSLTVPVMSASPGLGIRLGSTQSMWSVATVVG